MHSHILINAAEPANCLHLTYIYELHTATDGGGYRVLLQTVPFRKHINVFQILKTSLKVTLFSFAAFLEVGLVPVVDCDNNRSFLH